MKLGNVVIVLGKRLVNNQLSAEGISRVEALAAKIREMPMENTALVFCGGKTQGQSISEADAMYAYFQTLNTSLAKPFPTSQTLLENRSLNTFENMRNAAKVLCESGLFPLPSQATVEVILLSNVYHLERILEIQTLMDEQGLLRVIKSQCASVGLDLHISLDIQKHISVPYPQTNKQKKFEAVIKVPKGQLVASATHEDLYAAINEVEQKLERQLNKLTHKPEARRANKPELVEEEE